MMSCCSSFDVKNVCDKFNCKITETDKGIQINLEPKDKSKVKALQDYVKASKELCDCECC